MGVGERKKEKRRRRGMEGKGEKRTRVREGGKEGKRETENEWVKGKMNHPRVPRVLLL